MISMEKINSMWTDIQPQKGSTIARRADPEHPLDFFIGYDENCYMQLMLVTKHMLELPRSSQQVAVCGNSRNDGKYAICFSLSSFALKETFISLCWDIISNTYVIENKKSGVMKAVNRFGMWQKLLAEESNLKMSDAVVKGLLGELAMLYEKCFPKYGVSRAVSGWIGPLRADRDFEYEDTWYEVKAVSLSKDVVHIASFDQLDIDRTGYLVICRIEKTSVADPKAISLNSLVDKIREIIADDYQAMSTLLVRLRFNGYKAEDERANEPFVIHGFEYYCIEGDFPRIRRSEMSPAFSGGEYALSIAAIQKWRAE